MGNISAQEIKIMEEALFEALEKLLQEGVPMQGFKSHYAFILSFCQIQWGYKNGYQSGILTLDVNSFLNKNLNQRVSLLKNLLTDVIGDVFTSRKSHKT